VSPEKFGGYKGYALEGHEQQTERWITERPDITLAELRALLTKQKIVVGKSSIARFLDHLDLTFQKKLCTRQNKTGQTWPRPVGPGAAGDRRLIRGVWCSSMKVCCRARKEFT
jgi:transposase